MRIKLASIVFATFLFSFTAPDVHAENSYLTIVSLVRGSSSWVNHDRNWLEAQHQLIVGKEYASTWLADYDAISEFADNFRKFESNQEIGLFLEITPTLASKLKLPYNRLVSRNEPQNVFLSGYSIDQRRKIIDTLFLTYFEKFGYMPKSVGAWFVDSWSLDYMKTKYGIRTSLIVAEQYKTDTHTVRGHPWQTAYYPSKNNVLMPASELTVKQDVVVIQWAARHPLWGWGEGLANSNYSVQANDYTKFGLGKDYFAKLARTYLFNPLSDFNQLTVGIEVGQEGAEYFDEFAKQVDSIGSLGNLEIETASKFGESFRKRFPGLLENSIVSWQDENDPDKWALWFSGRKYRMGLAGDKNGVFVRDLRVYGPLQDDLFFSADRRNNLFRQTEAIIDEVSLGKRWQIWGEGIGKPTLEKKGNDFSVGFGDGDIVFGEKNFRLNFIPFQKVSSAYLWESVKGDVSEYSFREIPKENSGRFELYSGAFLLGILFAAVKFKRQREAFLAFFVAVFSIGFLLFQIYSLTPLNELGIGYFMRLAPKMFVNGVLAYIIGPLLYIGLGMYIFRFAKKASGSFFLGLLAQIIFFFSGSFGFLIVFYRHLALDGALVDGVAGNVTNFVWFFNFGSTDKLFFAFSAGQMNIDFLANAARSGNYPLILAIVFFQIVNLGILSLGICYLLYRFLVQKRIIYFILLLATFFLAPLFVNRVDLRLPTVADTFLTALGVMGLILFVNQIRMRFKIAGAVLIAAILLAMVPDFISLIRRNNEMFFRVHPQWADRGKAKTILGEDRVVDAFLWRLGDPGDATVYVPQGLGQYFFVDTDYSLLDLKHENSYFIIGALKSKAN